MPINEKIAIIITSLKEENPWGKLGESVFDYRWKFFSPREDEILYYILLRWKMLKFAFYNVRFIKTKTC